MNEATNNANSHRQAHIITMPTASQSELQAVKDELRTGLHGVDVRLVKLEQLVRFGGFIFVLLQLGVTIFLGLRSHGEPATVREAPAAVRSMKGTD